MAEELNQSNIRELLLWLLRRRRRFRVIGNSMLPLLNPGDEILVNLNAYRQKSPSPGDIVVAQHPLQSNVRLIKRVAVVLENGNYFLKGDNPEESTDSRTFGSIAPEQIFGRVTSRFF
ncbi:nickel-type superoxide dismutase maturation protease [Lusitaniella coriacea LEGE 07157]|uniref:Nickel-type superoxide dismutase maturation protease n=2 Tax=Lusitaniella TaxID=1983104 RepID=A0A8J7DY83_9CYAN|nr:nickel-type superoxide dismutase maturation protease [Lusitaniella coriacea LEGE 07157]